MKTLIKKHNLYYNGMSPGSCSSIVIMMLDNFSSAGSVSSSLIDRGSSSTWHTEEHCSCEFLQLHFPLVQFLMHRQKNNFRSASGAIASLISKEVSKFFPYISISTHKRSAHYPTRTGFGGLSSRNAVCMRFQLDVKLIYLV